MKLNKEEINELNNLLKDLDIPFFRKTVDSSGHNYKWLQKHILIKNPNIDSRIKELLNI